MRAPSTWLCSGGRNTALETPLLIWTIGIGSGGQGRLAPPTLPTVYIVNFIAVL